MVFERSAAWAPRPLRQAALIGLSVLATVLPLASIAAVKLGVPGLQLQIPDTSSQPQEVVTALKLLALLTLLSVAPAILIVMTSFTRIVIVLSMLRHATGMQDTPPNTVLVSLAVILTMFTMSPVFQQAYDQGFSPYINKKINSDVALTESLKPFREFMMRQTREQDVRLMLNISGTADPSSPDELRTIHLIPAFMLSELKTAFQIGFVIFLPFLLIDLIVSSILMAMGMLMVPPMMISLPLKVLMFVLIDGWNLVVGAVLESFR